MNSFRAQIASFWLTFANRTVEVRGGHSKSHDDVILTWTASRQLTWVRLLAVGVQRNVDGTHYFEVYRDVGQ